MDHFLSFWLKVCQGTVHKKGPPKMQMIFLYHYAPFAQTCYISSQKGYYIISPILGQKWILYHINIPKNLVIYIISYIISFFGGKIRISTIENYITHTLYTVMTLMT